MSRPSLGRYAPLLLVFITLAAASSFAVAEDSSDSPGNIAVRVVVRASDDPSEDPTSREYRMTLVPGQRSKVVHGRRLPIPTTSFDTSRTDDGGLVPVTSYSYQTVGFQANLEATLALDGRIKLDGSVEDSHVHRYRDGGPEITAIEQWVHVYLKPGETIVLHRSDSGQRKVEIRLQADFTG